MVYERPVVLLVEDDKALCRVLHKLLGASGLTSREVGTVADAIHVLREEPPQAILLDLRLPDAHGEAVLLELAAQSAGPPAIVLSAITDSETKCRLLRLGASDYITKPFEPQELILRIENVLAREGHRARIIRGGVDLSLWDHSIACGTRVCTMTPRACRMLALLLARLEEQVSWRELNEAIWRYSPDARTNTFRVHVLKVRRALAAVGAPLRLRTVRGAGVVLERCAEVSASASLREEVSVIGNPL